MQVYVYPDVPVIALWNAAVRGITESSLTASGEMTTKQQGIECWENKKGDLL